MEKINLAQEKDKIVHDIRIKIVDEDLFKRIDTVKDLPAFRGSRQKAILEALKVGLPLVYKSATGNLKDDEEDEDLITRDVLVKDLDELLIFVKKLYVERHTDLMATLTTLNILMDINEGRHISKEKVDLGIYNLAPKFIYDYREERLTEFEKGVWVK